MTATSDTALATLRETLGPLYQDYAYGYPHKSAYRPFDQPIGLRQLWQQEDKSKLFVYLHIPFCEMRCGFCNLFTRANPAADQVTAYLQALEREIVVVSNEVGPMKAARLALGGGTPTYLAAAELERLFGLLERHLAVTPQQLPAAIETSPKTATPERLKLLADLGISRISIGVQSFFEAEVKAMGRMQSWAELSAALDAIRDHHFERLNIDLIYGAANQTTNSWRHSIETALRWRPEEIFIYPLYVRRRTGLDGRAMVEDEHRRTLYRAGRERLLEAGYEQLSMRAFVRAADRLPNTPPNDCASALSAPADSSPEYSCQEDGMLGLGAGARSYTRAAHYSIDYAVSRGQVKAILDQYCATTDSDFGLARHGIEVSNEERLRRHVLKSILHRDGLDCERVEELYGVNAPQYLPALSKLVSLGLLQQTSTSRGTAIHPTALGLEHSDAIPPLLYSSLVRQRMSDGDVR